MTEPAYEAIARSACAPWVGHPDHADYLQEARLLAWRHDLPVGGLAVIIVRRRLIEQWRTANHICHRTGQPRGVTVPAGLDVTDTEHHDSPDVALEYGLTGRLATIAAGLAAGHPKQDVADELGVSPARVSHLLHDLRKALRCAGKDHDDQV